MFHYPIFACLPFFLSCPFLMGPRPVFLYISWGDLEHIFVVNLVKLKRTHGAGSWLVQALTLLSFRPQPWGGRGLSLYFLPWQELWPCSSQRPAIPVGHRDPGWASGPESGSPHLLPPRLGSFTSHCLWLWLPSVFLALENFPLFPISSTVYTF